MVVACSSSTEARANRKPQPYVAPVSLLPRTLSKCTVKIKPLLAHAGQMLARPATWYSAMVMKNVSYCGLTGLSGPLPSLSTAQNTPLR